MHNGEYVMMYYTADSIKELLKDTSSAEFLRLADAYDGKYLPHGDAAERLRRDLDYDPSPYISTLDYKPEDRIASIVHPLWSDELTHCLYGRLAGMIGKGRDEDLFRWNRAFVCDNIIAAAKDAEVRLPSDVMPSFYCPYSFSRLYMSGLVTAQSGILLRRTNCRPWGIKPL